MRRNADEPDRPANWGQLVGRGVAAVFYGCLLLLYCAGGRAATGQTSVTDLILAGVVVVSAAGTFIVFVADTVRTALRLRRQAAAAIDASAGRCPTCGYDLRATPDRCPECGAVPVSANGNAEAQRR